MNPALLDRLARLEERLDEINRLLASEDAASNLDQYRKLTREHAEVGDVVERYHAWKRNEDDLATAREMAGDPDMAELAREEIAACEARRETLQAELQTGLLPRVFATRM